MIVRLKITDELYEAYDAMAAARGKKFGVEDLMISQLHRFREIHPMDRPLVVGAPARQRLEAALGGVFIGSEEDLVIRIESVTDVQIQGVRVNFAPGQITSIRRYASKNGWTFEYALEQIIQSMAGQFADYVPA